MVLWRKLTKDTIETTCCLCDIGLMICDLDMNILAMFCLNALSENTETHEFIRNSGLSSKEYGETHDIKKKNSEQESFAEDENNSDKMDQPVKRHVSDGSFGK